MIRTLAFRNHDKFNNSFYFRILVIDTRYPLKTKAKIFYDFALQLRGASTSFLCFHGKLAGEEVLRQIVRQDGKNSSQDACLHHLREIIDLRDRTLAFFRISSTNTALIRGGPYSSYKKLK